MNDLYTENQYLRRNLRELVSKAKENQRILEYFQHFELELLSCRSLHSLFIKLLFGAQSHFELASCRLLLLDPEGATKKLLEYEQLQEFEGVLEFISHPELFKKLYGNEVSPQLKPLQEMEKARWFPWVPVVESCAMLPLLRDDQIIGSLHFGSVSRDRFTPDKAVDFMSRLASIIAVCLENCINQEHIRRLSLIDMLTRVKNRRSFDEDLSKELSRASRTLKPLSCLFIDADHFKQVNDNYGHQAGDVALKSIAQLISKQLRQTDHLARYGGEEFAALLPDCGRETAVSIAERVRQMAEIKQICYDSSAPFKVTLSIGVSTWYPQTTVVESDAWAGERLVASADNAVYDAKRGGRNRVCYKAYENQSCVVESGY